MGKKKKSKVKKSFQSTESIALNSLLGFLNLDENNATSEVTYFTCLKVLSEGIAKLPLDLQEVSDDGGIRDLKEEPLWRTVRVRPNPYMSPSSFWTIVENCRNHYGNAYVYIDRDTEKGVTLWPLLSDCMRIMMIGPDKTNSGLRESDDVLYIYNDPDNGQEYVFPSEDILHFRSSSIFGGLVGLSVQEKLKTSIYGAKRSQKMLNELYDSNFVPKAVLMFDGTAEMDQKNQETYLKMLQDYVEGKNSGAKSFLPLSRGTTVQPLNIRLTDGQFLELRQYTALQIAAAFGIKPNHLNDYTKSSYANSETQQLAFYTDTMLYNLKQYEEEMIYKLLSYGQQAKGWRFKFNIAAVLRGDTKSQVESLTQGISCGLYTPNEARRNIDLPNKPGGDRLYFNGSNIPVQDAGIQYREQEQSDNTKAILRLTESIEKAVECDIIYKKPVFGDKHQIVDNVSEGGGESSTSGALNPDSKKAREHADRYYESVRHMTNDVNRIASNTGFSVEEISTIKDFVFMQKHELDGKIERFAPSFEMSQSWQRLIDGKNIQPHDITLLKHELMERELMKKGFSQDEAHIRTSQKYNYAREAAEYYDKIDSDNKS